MAQEPVKLGGLMEYLNKLCIRPNSHEEDKATILMGNLNFGMLTIHQLDPPIEGRLTST